MRRPDDACRFIIGLALFLFAGTAVGAEAEPEEPIKALPCRPTIACTADFVPPGTFEVELGYIARRLTGVGFQHSTPVLLKLTVAKWLQLQVGSNGLVYTTGASPSLFVDEIAVVLKFKVLDQKGARPSVALSGSVGFPSGIGQTSAEEIYDAFFVAYVTKDIGWLHADLNLGANVWQLSAPIPQEWAALALSAVLPWSPAWTAMLEEYVFSDALPVSARDAGTLIAISYTPMPNVVIDAGGDIGWIWGYRSFSLFVGVTVAPFRLWGHGD